MRPILCFVAFTSALSMFIPTAGLPAAAPVASLGVLRLDPALDALIAPGAEVEPLGEGYVFTEGPMWRKGRLWFSDEEGDRIHALTEDGQDTLLASFGDVNAAQEAHVKTGPNAMASDQDGNVLLAEQYGRAVVRLVEDAGTVHAEPLFDRYEGKRLNSPNDLVFLPDGSFFFTDPPYGLKLRDADPAKELPFNGVFHVSHGKLTPVIKDLTLPNGVALSPDNRTLYVNNSGPVERVMAYPVHADGSTGTGRTLITFTGSEGHGVPDGLKVDARGDIWTTGPGGIRVLTATGKVLGQIITPQVAANVAWGGVDGCTLYITAQSHVYRIRTRVQGKLPVFGQGAVEPMSCVESGTKPR